MIRLNLVCVGRIREKYFADACREYEKRLTRFCKFCLVEAPECAEGDPKRVLAREEEGILRALEGKVILFDPAGQKLSSEGLSLCMTRLSERGDTLTFVIGGSHGVSENVKSRADLRLSVSDMTFPHMLFRVMAEEQLYRAFMIASGASYHK